MNSRVEDPSSTRSTTYRSAAEVATIDNVNTSQVDKPAKTTAPDKKSQQAVWLVVANIKPDAIHPVSSGCYYSFSSPEAANHQLAIIQDVLKDTHTDIQNASVSKKAQDDKTPYHFYLTQAQLTSLEKLKASDRLVKVIRWDSVCFLEAFISGITRTPAIQDKQPLRSNIRGNYTVFASGVYPRNNKPLRYSPEELSKKAALSQHQSTSLVTYDAQGPVFGHDKNRRDKLVGVMLDPDDAIINRLFIYDGGTVGRPYEFNSKDDATKYHNIKTSPSSRTLFDTMQSFKLALSNLSKDKHNEVLARIRWNCASSTIGIFSDTFEARCIAQYYAETLLTRLKQSYTELGKVWDETYQIPFVYYLPNSKKNWTTYSDDEKQKDIQQACAVFNDIANRNAFIKAGKGEFLLVLPNPADVLQILETDNNHPLIQMIANEDFQLLSAIFKRANLKITLADYLKNYLQTRAFSQAESTIHCFTLYRAVETAYVDIVDSLLSIKHLSATINSIMLLHVAAEKGHLAMVNTLLLNGADVNLALTTSGKTPLHLATEKGHLAVVNTLLEKGADVNLARTDGLTPLHAAALDGQLAVVNTLLEKGADVNLACTIDGLTPLHLAAENGQLAVVNTLLQKGANVNLASTTYGATALHLAAQHGQLAVVTTLLERGANVKGRTTKRSLWECKAPHTLAFYRHHYDITKLILAKRLRNYIEDRDLDPRQYKKSYVVAGITFNYGYSKKEELKAALTLLNVLNGNADTSKLKEYHCDVDNPGELTKIYRKYYKYRLSDY